jgi:hypothetical protein
VAIVQYTVTHKQYIEHNIIDTKITHNTQLTNWKECRPCPVFASYTVTFALQLRRKHRKTSVREIKNLSQGRKICQGRKNLSKGREKPQSGKLKTSVRVVKNLSQGRKICQGRKNLSQGREKPQSGYRKTSVRVEKPSARVGKNLSQGNEKPQSGE